MVEIADKCSLKTRGDIMVCYSFKYMFECIINNRNSSMWKTILFSSFSFFPQSSTSFTKASAGKVFNLQLAASILLFYKATSTT